MGEKGSADQASEGVSRSAVASVASVDDDPGMELARAEAADRLASQAPDGPTAEQIAEVFEPFTSEYVASMKGIGASEGTVGGAVEWVREWAATPDRSEPARSHSYPITVYDVGLQEKDRAGLTAFLNKMAERGAPLSEVGLALDFYTRTLKKNHGALFPMKKGKTR